MSGYRLVRPVLFTLPAERAHGLAIGGLALIQGTPLEAFLAGRYTVEDPRLAVETLGNHFPNPVGVAAGFDKNARVPNALGALGFGHVEVGGVTEQAQAGNPQPRLFRLTGDRALINRMGFNNDGVEAIADRLERFEAFRVPIGVNIGKSKDTPLAEAPEEYRRTYEQLAEVADYVVINVSSPNTPGLRELQARGPLEKIVASLTDAGAEPLLIKLSPDLTEPAIDEVIEVVETHDLDGVVAVNTTVNRPAELTSVDRDEEGGLSGEPLARTARETVAYVAQQTDRPIIGVGGIDGPDRAYEMIRAGASLVQLYTGLVFEGPSLARQINRGLLDRIERDGFASVEEAIGADQ